MNETNFYSLNTKPPLLFMNVASSAAYFNPTFFDPITNENYGIQLPASITNSVQNKQAEYVASRLCTQEAFRILGEPYSPVGKGADGEPQWPKGITGSLTHCSGFTAVGVAYKHHVKAIGLDSEIILTQEVLTEVMDTIALPFEIQRAKQLEKNFQFQYFTLLFSAKECIYKALFPLVNIFFGFHDAEIIDLDFSSRRFRAKLLKTLNAEFQEGFILEGQFSIDTQYVHTGLVLNSDTR